MVATPANGLNISSAGLVKFDGTATFSGVTTTNHNLLIGATSNGITNVAPSATSGVPVISQGSSADPTFGTAVVAGGGTGAVSFTAYGVLLGGTTTTGALQSVTPSATTTALLTSGGTGAVAAWKNLSVNIQVFTSNGTYTPTSGMVYCIIQCVGGGGAGGGGASATAGNYSTGGGGGSGEYAVGVFSSATIGSSQSVTIGNGGTGSSGADGGNGATTTVGSTLISAGGGNGGVHSSASTAVVAAGGSGGSGGTGGSYRLTGQTGATGWATVSILQDIPGTGGSNPLGFGGQGVNNGTGGAGNGYGSGGGGAGDLAGSTARTGGAGAKGVVLITEYVIS